MKNEWKTQEEQAKCDPVLTVETLHFLRKPIMRSHKEERASSGDDHVCAKKQDAAHAWKPAAPMVDQITGAGDFPAERDQNDDRAPRIASLARLRAEVVGQQKPIQAEQRNVDE